jgi:hypothetical protein
VNVGKLYEATCRVQTHETKLDQGVADITSQLFDSAKHQLPKPWSAILRPGKTWFSPTAASYRARSGRVST